MTRYHDDDENFTTVLDTEGKPTRILADRGRVRVSMTMRDATMAKHQNAKPSFVDGNGTPLDLGAGNRPGFRIPVSDARQNARQNIVEDSYRKYQCEISNRYKVHDGEVQCAECFGSGEGPDGEACNACNGSGVMPDERSRSSKGGKGFGSRNEGGYDNGDDPDPASDSRTLDQKMLDHKTNMDRLIRERDLELSEMWRTK